MANENLNSIAQSKQATINNKMIKSRLSTLVFVAAVVVFLGLAWTTQPCFAHLRVSKAALKTKRSVVESNATSEDAAPPSHQAFVYGAQRFFPSESSSSSYPSSYSQQKFESGESLQQSQDLSSLSDEQLFNIAAATIARQQKQQQQQLVDSSPFIIDSQPQLQYSTPNSLLNDNNYYFFETPKGGAKAIDDDSQPTADGQELSFEQFQERPAQAGQQQSEESSFKGLLNALKSYWAASLKNDEPDTSAANTIVVKNTDNENDEGVESKWSFLKKASVAPIATPNFKEESIQSDEYEAEEPKTTANLLGKYLFSPSSILYKSEEIEKPKQSDVKVIKVPTSDSSSNIVDVKRAKFVSLDELHHSNDLYFLVSVMGVCGLAATVVLAAGMFVYKIQVARQCEPDDDLPTYGVVGPNNLSVAIESSKQAKAAKFGSDLASNLAFDNNNSRGSPIKFGNSYDKQQQQAAGKKVDAVCQKLGAGNNPFAPLGANNKTVFLAGATNDAAMYHFQRQKQQMITNPNARAINNQNVTASDFDSDDDHDDDEDEENYTVYECPGLASAHNMEIKNPLFNDDATPVNSPPATSSSSRSKHQPKDS